jgi:hypothetical protein
MKLIHQATGVEVKVGDTLTYRDGATTVLRYIQKPHKPASTGRVYVSQSSAIDAGQGYFPSVFDLVWVEREDQL